MRSVLASLTVVVLVLSQMWVASARGHVVCVSAQPLKQALNHSAKHTDCHRDHDHAHPQVMGLHERADPCDHCFHISVPDDPQVVPNHTQLQQHLLAPAYELSVMAWALPAAAQLPSDSRWSTPPPWGAPLAQTSALACTRLMI